MTDEEIKKIARKFAELKGGHAVCSETEIQKRALLLEQYTHFLMEDFCIVPKSEILADYEFNAGCFAQFSASGDDRCNKIAQWHKDKCDELESLCGKDMFEEEGK